MGMKQRETEKDRQTDRQRQRDRDRETKRAKLYGQKCNAVYRRNFKTRLSLRLRLGYEFWISVMF